jgi:hypothetical protein
MSEHQIQLVGWQKVVAGVVLVGILGVRLATFSDQKDNTKLVENLKVQLVSDYFPNEVAKLKSAMDSGNKDLISATANSVTSAKLNIESVKTSYPLFAFTSNKEVVVKVTYSLDDDSGNRGRKTNYYLYRYGALTDSWSYQHDTGAVRYYMNFI